MTKQSTSFARLSGFITGALIGGMVGTGLMLLTAPQSGRKTRALLQRKGLELEAQVTDKADEARLWAEAAWWDTLLKLRHLQHELITKAQELQYHGQVLLEEQMGHLVDVVEGHKPKEKAKAA